MTSDIENNHRRVKFGPEFYYYKNIDPEEEVSEGTINEILEPEMSPLKKIKKLIVLNLRSGFLIRIIRLLGESPLTIFGKTFLVVL